MSNEILVDNKKKFVEDIKKYIHREIKSQLNEIKEKQKTEHFEMSYL